MAGIEVCGLQKTYSLSGTVVSAINEISFRAAEGEFIVIVGRSGCGKTTLLRLVAGLEAPDAGCVTFISDRKELQRERLKVSMVFQEPRLMPWLTVAENMALPLRHNPDRTEVQTRVNKNLELLGLTKFRTAYPNQLSGGMAQRVSLGRALCYQPDIILMDEPLGALDAFTRRSLQQELISLLSGAKAAVLFVTHDVEEALLLGQTVLVMEQGRFIKTLSVSLPYPRRASHPEAIRLREEILSTILRENKEEY